MFKIYATRSLTRTMGLFDPIGDPFGGVAYGEKNDPVTALVAGGAGLVGSMIQGNAAQRAAQTQADANARAQEQLLATGQQASQNFAPYQQTGQVALNQINANMPYFTKPFTNADLNAYIAPNYEFQLEQGQQANMNQANALGGAVSGNALQGLNTFSQNFAQNAYQNALSNYQNQQTNIFNRLSNIAGIGQQAATGAANAQLGVGSNVAQISQGTGQAFAAGQMGQANALSNGFTNAGNYYLLSNLMQKPTPASSGLGPEYYPG